jgi:hypothetical protein
MVDLKSKKIFLKKSPCPEYISKDDFIIGGKVNIIELSDLLFFIF